MLIGPAVLPTLGRSKRALYVLAAIAAIVPAYWWVVAFSPMLGEAGMYVAIIVLATTASWGLGMTIAVLQMVGINNGWRWARYPFPALTALVVIGALTLLIFWRSPS